MEGASRELVDAPSTVPTVQESVLRWMRKALITGVFKPGDRIRQEAISESAGASLVPVREALKVLAAEGQLTYLPRRGYVVTELSFDELQEIYDLRRLLETETVSRAMPHFDDELVATMREYAAQVEEFGRRADIMALMGANYEFHFAMYRAADSRHLVRLVEFLWDSTSAYRALYFNSEQEREHPSHGRIVDAIEAGDRSRIIHELDSHRQRALSFLEQILP